MGPMNPMNMNQQQMQAFLQQAIQANPQMANNPQAQNIIQVLMSGDAQAGEQLARNLAQSMGVQPQDLAQQSMNYFQQRMQQGGFPGR